MIEEWLEYEDEYTDELLRHEGLGGLPATPHCDTCSAHNALYRCVDCFHEQMLCELCVVAAHQSDVLHRIKVMITYIPFSSFLTDVFRNGVGSSSPLFPCSTLVLP